MLRRRAAVETAGSIPACAGKPWLAINLSSGCSTGPSPRVRGSLRSMRRFRPAVGSGVHPRVCGEAAGIVIRIERYTGPSPRVREADRLGIFQGQVEGPSPRVRGSRPDPNPPVSFSYGGSIPACAGKPVVRARRKRQISGLGPSPRVRGSPLPVHVHGAAPGRGPSPRVRGSLRCSESSDGPVPRVHPRVCGEAARWKVSTVARSTRWSIPACAGKPRRCRSRGSTTRCGPSPRVRGSRVLPASFGRSGTEPGPSPRVRGSPRGGSFESFSFTTGPSPRVRGSLEARLAVQPWVASGSIPACAGKPPEG